MSNSVIRSSHNNRLGGGGVPVDYATSYKACYYKHFDTIFTWV